MMQLACCALDSAGRWLCSLGAQRFFTCNAVCPLWFKLAARSMFCSRQRAPPSWPELAASLARICSPQHSSRASLPKSADSSSSLSDSLSGSLSSASQAQRLWECCTSEPCHNHQSSHHSFCCLWFDDCKQQNSCAMGMGPRTIRTCL